MAENNIDIVEFDHMSEISDEEIDVRDIFKIVFLGDSGVGKTNIMCRFTTDTFNINSKPTIGVDFGIKTIALGGHIIKLQLWDTAGQERYRTFTSAYFKDSLGMIIVYDITNMESFRSVDKWLEIAKEYIAFKSIKLLLLGNKIDLDEDRQVSILEASDYAEKHDMVFMEVSALDNRQNCVNEGFFKLIKSRVIRHHQFVFFSRRR
jgi:small GTP-binding protein